MASEAVSLSQLKKAELVELVLQLRGKDMGRSSETDTATTDTTTTPDPGIQEMLTQQESFQKKDKPETAQTILSTREVPDLPELTEEDNTDQGWINLKKEYETYVVKCQNLSIVPRTIDNCLRGPIRDTIRIGIYDQEVGGADVIRPEWVITEINRAVKNFPALNQDNLLADLEEKVEKWYDETIDNVYRRVATFRTKILVHLHTIERKICEDLDSIGN